MTDTPGERARFWRHPGLPGIDLLKAHYVRHSFNRHTHDTYAIGVIEDGIEEFAYRGATHRVGRGDLVVVEPEEVHTGHAGTPEGWRYRMLYPEVDVVAQAARDLGMPDVPGFGASGTGDPASGGLMRTAHRAAEHGDRLSASTLMRQALHHLLSRHARARPADPGPQGPDRAVAEARDLLHARLADPPSLDELAAAVDVSPFALLRAFRAAHGLPPHAYLNNLRVLRARRLLAAGMRPAAVAGELGFADQPHLTRHFKRQLGVTPGSFRQGVLAARGAGTTAPGS
ncbi:AraC family transcriptional regulator [Nocardiopsis gilva YIM 90087]|uniref:AraC family transcriptional regulator n=1 Tax=Nocardiopsis gilva YIM 90087 TaxID=1235441 RepID=A0A223S5Z0_9ACTN|nr:AraC family transcriptional regulator [Nocardiopsis gilva]ASU83439.1 AraC family transcriptional regulator [Nocardiopsis gilva YIM 90087]